MSSVRFARRRLISLRGSLANATSPSPNRVALSNQFITSSTRPIATKEANKVVKAADIMMNYPMILSERPAICNIVPPGQCQFNPTFQSVPLLDRIPCGTGGTSFLLRFGVPDMTKSMGLTTCACILASAELMDREKGELVEVTRPYTVSNLGAHRSVFRCEFLAYKRCSIFVAPTCSLSALTAKLVALIYSSRYVISAAVASQFRSPHTSFAS